MRRRSTSLIPDTDATYWTTPYRVEPGTRFIVKGTFPNACVSCRLTPTRQHWRRIHHKITFRARSSTIKFHQTQARRIRYQHTTRRKAGNSVVTSRRLVATVSKCGSSPTCQVRNRTRSQAHPQGTAAGSIGFPLMRVCTYPGCQLPTRSSCPSISIITASEPERSPLCSPKKQKLPNAVIPGLDIRRPGGRPQTSLPGDQVRGTGNWPSSDAARRFCTEHCSPARLRRRPTLAPELRKLYVGALFTPNHPRGLGWYARRQRTPR